ncbi:hypothetical protein IM538_13870 [Cytobacillus suaedae]|nr:hypothetical protein IM538_13870 [Cytobacillus suaedae]
MVKTFGFTIIFAFIYMLITVNLDEILREVFHRDNIIVQINYGLIIGVLIWIGIKLADKGK